MMEDQNTVFFNGSISHEEEETILSKRGASTKAYEDFLCPMNGFRESSWEPFHHINNPDGHIGMRMSVNRLMEEELAARLVQSDALSFRSEHQHYYDLFGIAELRGAVARFLTTHFRALQSLLPENVVLMNGVTSCLDAVAHVLCDPGDVIITPTPTYPRIVTDVEARALAHVVPLVMSPEEDSEGKTFSLRAEALEACIKEAKANGQRVRAFVLVNPHNPLGDVYPPTLLSRLLDVCARYQIHFVSNEIYGLSLFGETVFHSVLSLPHPDPQRTHLLWGMSKDLGLAGLRVGAVVSRSPEVITCLKRIADFQSVPYVVQQATAAILNDKVWYEEHYLPTNTRRLTEAYQWACSRLEDMGVAVRKAEGGFFTWVNLQPFLPRATEEEEMALYDELVDAGVSTVPGTKMYSSQPGWFRLIFAISRPELEEGLKRVEKVLNARGNVRELNSSSDKHKKGI